MATSIPACRICGSSSLEPILSLGDMPAVNSFLPSHADIPSEGRYPLAIAFCASCTHVQLTHQLDPRDVFVDYIYFSSMSETVVRHGESLAARYRKELDLKPDQLVAELASNDGCILRPFKQHCRVYGVEPAKNIAQVAVESGVPTKADFFSSNLARELRTEVGGARLILARNVVAHVPEVVDFIAGAAHWLTDDGILHIEVPYLKEMVDKLEFDTIYHEHLSYFSVTALNELFRRAGLTLWDVEELGLHGGSLIARGRKNVAPTARVAQYLAEERATGLTRAGRLHAFAEGTRRLQHAIPEFIDAYSRSGRRLAAYGAAAKGVILTNYCKLDTKQLAWVADRSPYKQGKLMPGVHIPVVSPERIAADHPDALLVLAWNFIDEIVGQQRAYADRGGKFIVPVPVPSEYPDPARGVQ